MVSFTIPGACFPFGGFRNSPIFLVDSDFWWIIFRVQENENPPGIHLWEIPRKYIEFDEFSRWNFKNGSMYFPARFYQRSCNMWKLINQEFFTSERVSSEFWWGFLRMFEGKKRAFFFPFFIPRKFKIIPNQNEKLTISESQKALVLIFCRG